ncbi:hypothetical protein DCAR_0622968 [Daucus carota subsp. sativus]|uniref:Uncharacterized protein n=1 Tax=Daucus carota subsp. sativus TaxID=79200 RepID=A0A164UZ71_DAUCS|nr:hypothetical protein DCAR_0622968 [Daucus carota subsp. sativus]
MTYVRNDDDLFSKMLERAYDGEVKFRFGKKPAAPEITSFRDLMVCNWDFCVRMLSGFDPFCGILAFIVFCYVI